MSKPIRGNMLKERLCLLLGVVQIEGESLAEDGELLRHSFVGIERPPFVFRPRPKHVQQQNPLWPRELDRPFCTDSFEGTEDAVCARAPSSRP